jgi:PAS domain-containing protein
LSWEPGLIGLHGVSDALIGIAYFSIPLALASLTRQRPDFKFSGMMYAFVSFILACGTTHLFSVLTLWVPAYGVEGLVKAVTAVLSLATAFLLWPLVPRLVALPSPAQLHRVNADLSVTVAEHELTLKQLRVTEARVQAANVELEQRVAERTSELRAMNKELAAALAERLTAQQALARSEAEFRASFEGSVVGMALVEPASRRILRANRVLSEMLGYTPEELVGPPAISLGRRIGRLTRQHTPGCFRATRIATSRRSDISAGTARHFGSASRRRSPASRKVSIPF